ncbi:MAG TPA: DUF6152 family protein [Sphingobium sp.]|nr:DUF6152 family protein [Sphingobium sp.]
MNRIISISLIVAAVSASSVLPIQPAVSHHSFAMFDRTKEVTLVGTVKSFEWTNPHSWLQVVVRDARGGTKEYSIEMGSPNTMSRSGWRKTTFKPGDRVTVKMNPMRDGAAGGAFVSAVNAEGKTLPLN